MAKSNNSNLILAVIITCFLTAGIAVGILFATKPWCSKKGDNNKPSNDLSLGRQQDFAPSKCGISNLHKGTPDCKQKCKTSMHNNCPELSLTYCNDYCDSGGPTPAKEDGYTYGDECGAQLTSTTSLQECSTVATHCCTLKCKGDQNCIQICTGQAVQGHCMARPSPSPDGPPFPGGGGNGGGGNGGGGSNVQSDKPFYEQPLGIGLIVFCVLVVIVSLAVFVMWNRNKKGRR